MASTCASRDTRVIFLPDGRVSSNATVNNPVENKTNTLEDFGLDFTIFFTELEPCLWCIRGLHFEVGERNIWEVLVSFGRGG